MPYIIPSRTIFYRPKGRLQRMKRRRNSKPSKRGLGRRPRRYGPGGMFAHPKWDGKLRRKQNRPFLIQNTKHLPLVRKNSRGEYILHPDLRNAYAISIRTPKWRALQRRLGPWRKHVKHFQGTVVPSATAADSRLSAGQLGCYDSHVRLWKKIARENSKAFIMEDDVALFYHPQVSQRLNYLFQQIRKRKIAWDILFVFHSTGETGGRKLAPGVSTVVPWDGLYGYVIKASGARKLLRHAYPVRNAVDMYVAEQIVKGRVRAIRSNPSLGFVVPGKSDTMGR
jgi:hypothetical protein